MWEFLSEHPWWGFIYLFTICSTVTFIAVAIAQAHRSSFEPVEEPEPTKPKRDDLH